ncbi:hypothetical protein L3Q82_008184 [Scortum barcoo]|uniref:Uncharacterized protein n=1 Tax=Scortum barcoo TaxID=214431 RepID=A0ACB8WH57_9TELE|nr:hypothetical protein L3Q82_008184 [Scortum barcoo]
MQKWSCSHKKGVGYNDMYWYRQLPGEKLELIVFTTLGIENHDFGNFTKTKFTATKPDGDNGTFTVKNLQPGDKGLYFCASVSQCRNREEGKDIMIRNLSRIALLLLWLSCRSFAEHRRPSGSIISTGTSSRLSNHQLQTLKVSKNSAHQTPARLIKHPGEEALINCSHSNTDFDMIQWYKQSPGKNDMALIGYVRFIFIVVEDKFKDAYNVTGSSPSDQIYQTPAQTYDKPGKSATISCSHSIQNYDQILWYKQSKNGELQLLGYMTGDSGFPETGVNVKIEGNAQKDQNCTLTIKQLSLNSSAVYFCAARLHSAAYHCSSVQKPHHMFSSLYYSSQPLTPVFIPLCHCQDVTQDPEISWSYLSEICRDELQPQERRWSQPDVLVQAASRGEP